MIKASEIRVGNLIIANGLHEGKIMTVNGIDNSTLTKRRVISFKEHSTGEFAMDCLPIDLTEEWLTRCGFECAQATNMKGYTLNGFYVFEPNDTPGLFYTMVGGKPVELKYLHQLQDAFALTGTELEIN